MLGTASQQLTLEACYFFGNSMARALCKTSHDAYLDNKLLAVDLKLVGHTRMPIMKPMIP